MNSNSFRFPLYESQASPLLFQPSNGGQSIWVSCVNIVTVPELNHKAMITEEIPITKAAPRSKIAAQTQNAITKIKNEIRVFLVDDDKFFLGGLYYFLADSLSPKIKLRKFSTAEECMEAMDEEPAIIVLDYMLSTESAKAMNGLSALKKINEISPGTLVIMLSAQDNIETALETLNEGAYDYISKSETAFLRLKNTIKNIAETISENMEQDRAETITKRINFLIILFLALLIIMNIILH
jgi:two-component system OmpR family response regulator